MARKTASSDASLIATKDTGTPSTDADVKTAGQGAKDSSEKRVAITVKLLESPYLRMKAYGAQNRLTNQNILEEALNDYLDKVGA